ncbi:MAG: hypothetical protein ACM3JB_06825 [Acidobacteriaceae bacterium]
MATAKELAKYMPEDLNQNGNLTEEFRKLNEDTAIWVRGDRAWRKRYPGDSEGRRQEY